MRIIKEITIAIHKYTGTLLSLLFLMWCITGFVLLFAGFPHASRQERFLNLETFTQKDFSIINIPTDNQSGSFELEMYNTEPIYRIKKAKKIQTILNAETLEQKSLFSIKNCKAVALIHINSEIIKTDSLNNLDSWIPWSYYKPLLPFYKFYFADTKHTVLYVSAKNGNIIQQTNRKSRWLARIGAIPHWIYFKQIKSKVKLWKNLILALGLIGLLSCISGIIMGFIRLKRNKNGRKTTVSVYKKPMYKYHHLFGLFFGLILCSYMLSGIFYATGVPSWISEKEKGTIVLKQWNKEKSSVFIHPDSIFRQLPQKIGIRKIAWGQSMQKLVVKIYYSDYKKAKVFQVDSVGRINKFITNERAILTMAKKIFPNLKPTISLQKKYDFYYQHCGMFYHPLPVFKLMLNNTFNDALYINAKTGKAVEYFNNNKRARKVLTKSLHKFELPILYKYNTLRIIVSIILLIACTLISYTAFVLGLRCLKRTFLNKQ